MRDLSPVSPVTRRRLGTAVGTGVLTVALLVGLTPTPEEAPASEEAVPLVVHRAHPRPPIQLARLVTEADTLDPAPSAPDSTEVLAEEPPVEAPEAEDAGQSLGSGMASYYGRELAGNRTASGERFNPNDLTAAHRTLPFGSRLRVTNARTGASVVVRVNDRGPFTHRRVIDVSERAARELGMIRAGTARVDLHLLPQSRG